MTEKRETYRVISPPYRGSFPNTSCTPRTFTKPDDAYEAAASWCKAYRERDPYGNMANVLGVTIVEGGKYVGVMNYYHSNT
jgi:hypothetical protein